MERKSTFRGSRREKVPPAESTFGENETEVPPGADSVNLVVAGYVSPALRGSREGHKALTRVEPRITSSLNGGEVFLFWDKRQETTKSREIIID